MNLHPFTKRIIALACLGVLAAAVIPEFIRTRMTRSLNACVDKNLWDIADATTRWAERCGKAPGSIPTGSDLLPYLPAGKMPVCPGGGTYILGPVGFHPSCSLSNEHPWSPMRF